MSQKNYSAVKFDVAEALGEWMNCLYIKEDNQGQIHYDFIQHRVADGVSGVTLLLQKEGHQVLNQPGLKKGTPPNFFKKLVALKKYISLTKKVPINWKKQRIDITGIPETYAIIALSEKETLALHDKVKSEKISLNSYILWALDKTVAENLLTKESARKWIAPLNMRPKDSKKLIMGNDSASIITNVLPSDHPLNGRWFHNQVSSYLKDGTHWGSQVYSNMAKYIGFKGTLKVAKGIKEVGTGVFSNLGAWPHQGVILDKDSDNIIWRNVLVPTTQILPVGGATWQWKDRLALSLQLHPSLNLPSTECEVLLNEWIKNLGAFITSKATLQHWKEHPECPRELIRRKQ